MWIIQVGPKGNLMYFYKDCRRTFEALIQRRSKVKTEAEIGMMGTQAQGCHVGSCQKMEDVKNRFSLKPP